MSEQSPMNPATPDTGEPTVENASVPVWFWCLSVAMVFVGALYLGVNSGGFKANVFNPDQVSWVGGGAPAGPPDPKVIGTRLFSANCVVCHQASGEGVPGQFPPLVDSEWVLSKEWHGDNHLVKLVLSGMQGPVTVKGQPFNNAMPAWKQLKDSEIAAILTYIRSEWGNNAAPIPADFVAKIREEIADRSDPWTQAELQAIDRVLVSEAEAAPAPEEAPADPNAQPPAPEADQAAEPAPGA